MSAVLFIHFSLPISPFYFLQPPTLRCAVLSAFVDIVLKILSGTLKEETDRMQRDRMLARLKVHLHSLARYSRRFYFALHSSTIHSFNRMTRLSGK